MFQFHCLVKQGTLVLCYRFPVCFMRVMCDICAWGRVCVLAGVLIKGEIVWSRMLWCHMLSPSTSITGYGGDCLSSCLGLCRCTAWVEVKFTPGTLRQHVPSTDTHTQWGCSWLWRSTEETVFYHFVYLLATKSPAMCVCSRWRRVDGVCKWKINFFYL